MSDTYPLKPQKHNSLISPTTALKLLLSAVVFGALVYVILLETGIEGLVGIVKGVNSNGLLCFIALSSIALLVRALRYRALVAAIAGDTFVPRYSRFFIITTLRNVLVDLLPARLGDLSFIYFAHRFQIPVTNAATAFGICFALDIIVLLVLICGFVACAPLLSSTGVFGDQLKLFEQSNVYTLTIGLALLTSVLLWWFVSLLPELIEAGTHLIRRWNGGQKQHPAQGRIAQGRIERFVKKLDEVALLVAAQIRTLQSSRRFLPLLGLSVVLRLIKYSSLYILLVAVVSQWGYGYRDINPLLSTFAFVTAEGVASLPISGFLGFGAYEGAWGMIFSLSHVKIPSVTSVIFAVHLITQMVAYIYGLVGFLMFLLSNKSCSIAAVRPDSEPAPQKRAAHLSNS